MLKRIKIEGFKSLVEAEVRLAELNVLFGSNAAGKSNFFEGLRLLSRLGTEQTLADAIDAVRGYPHEAFTFSSAEGVEGLMKREAADLQIEADLSIGAGDDLRYRVAVRIHPKTASLSVGDEYLARLKGSGQVKESILPRIERINGQLVVRRLSEAGPGRQEELGLNHTLLSNRQFSGAERYPDFDRLRGELTDWRVYYLDPRETMRAPQPPREVSDIGERGQWLAPFLHRLKEQQPAAFSAVRRALHSAIPAIDTLDVDLDTKHGTLDVVVVQSGTRYSSRVISEGTLRVLALCAIAANPWPAALVAFEEPENGVHPRRVRVIADLLANLSRSGATQVLVTTHSPVLVAEMLKQKKERPEQVQLLAFLQEGHATRISPLAPVGDLFEPEDRKAVEQLLDEPEERVVHSLMRRGWLDG